MASVAGLELKGAEVVLVFEDAVVTAVAVMKVAEVVAAVIEVL